MDLGGGAVNARRVFRGSALNARGQVDLLSVGLHLEDRYRVSGQKRVGRISLLSNQKIA